MALVQQGEKQNIKELFLINKLQLTANININDL